jgi:sporulation protein YlmC with PRC-barrel domain
MARFRTGAQNLGAWDPLAKGNPKIKPQPTNGDLMPTGQVLACLIASTFMAAPALAQIAAPQTPAGSTGTSMPLMQPAQSATAADQKEAFTAASPQGQGQIMQGQNIQGQPATASLQPLATPQAGQMLGSDLRGTRVYGANQENIGDISDILLDREGRVVAVIVGVGGFLGIGQKDVAVPYQALEIVAHDRAGVTGTASRGGPANGMNPSVTEPTTTGAVGTPGTGSTAMGAPQGTVNPDRIVLKGMTKADLENAPSFRADGRVTSSQQGTTGQSGNATTAPTSSGMAPAGAAPTPR